MDSTEEIKKLKRKIRYLRTKVVKEREEYISSLEVVIGYSLTEDIRLTAEHGNERAVSVRDLEDIVDYIRNRSQR